MVQELLALPWWILFLFGLKVMSAWLCALIIVVLPIAVFNALFGD